MLLAGILTAGTYFTDRSKSESEIRILADALYRRVDWRWAQNGKATLSQGWKPERGFLHYGWEGYSEAIILYILAFASPTYPAPSCHQAWTGTYQWENLYGRDFLYASPLFIHQFLTHGSISEVFKIGLCAKRVVTISKIAVGLPTFSVNTHHAIHMSFATTVKTAGDSPLATAQSGSLLHCTHCRC
jgi:hypothetical protein